jgi:hypothetical protein
LVKLVGVEFVDAKLGNFSRKTKKIAPEPCGSSAIALCYFATDGQ